MYHEPTSLRHEECEYHTKYTRLINMKRLCVYSLSQTWSWLGSAQPSWHIRGPEGEGTVQDLACLMLIVDDLLYSVGGL